MQIDANSIEAYLSVGQYVLIQTEPRTKDGARFSTSILGWKSERSILVEHPKSAEGREAAVREGQSCVVRFVHEGVACAFSSYILERIGLRTGNQLCLRWPQQVECQALRRSERVRIRVPCKMILPGGEDRDGQLCDLSTGGCGVLTDAPVATGEIVSIQFSCPDSAESISLTVVVRVWKRTPEGAFLGCEFEAGHVRAKNCIAFIVGMELARKRDRAEAQPSIQRVMIVDNKTEMLEALKESVGGQDIETCLATCSMDALHALRSMPLQAVAVSYDLSDLPGADLCRLIRAAPGMEHLPLFLYGGNETASGLVMAAGLNRWFPASESMTSELATELIHSFGFETVAQPA